VTLGGKPANEFLSEATEILDSLSRDLLALDEHRGEEADADRVNGLFRGFHSLKGLSALFVQERMTALSHAAEDLLDRVRLGKVELSDVVLDALLDSLDLFGELLQESVRATSTPALSERAEGMARRFSALAQAGQPASPAAPHGSGERDPLEALSLDPALRNVFTEYEEHRLRENLRKGVALWKVRATFSLNDFDVKLALLSTRLKPLGEILSTLPAPGASAEGTIAFDLLVGSASPKASLEGALLGLEASMERLTPELSRGSRPPPGVVRATTPEEPEPVELEADPETHEPVSGPRIRSEAEPSARSLTQTVRVDIGRLDALMNAVGELLLIKANLQRLAEQARGATGMPRSWGQELGRETQTLHRRLDELQKGILEARMVPLAQVFDRLARLVRRVVREVGKELDLSLSGGDVELDKLIVEELSDPLMHILHNAIDHGLEAPSVRQAAGKARRGTLALKARQRGNHVVIDISDDGSGLDEERIREVAVAKGLLTADQAEEMGRRELLNLIFVPGFSTARSVSELSGRGVGLDVVKTNIANLSGIIDVTSEPGKGTMFSLTLPVTLAIIRALVVVVSGRVYAVPLNSVLEILSLEEREIHTVERREVIAVRGQTIPLSRLARLFQLPEERSARPFVVVVGLAQKRVGFLVNDLQGQQDIVIKPLGGRLMDIPGVSGATDLGNRRTVLVLDVGALMDEVISPERHAEFF
jgi:two-component system, chemotaxis family, sensor kinase CheA